MLTVTAIRNLKPRAKPYKVADGRGLFLLVHPNGGKYWRLKYRAAGRERLLSFGVFPEVSLVEARQRCDAARLAIRNGADPATEHAQEKAEERRKAGATFERLAKEWLARRAPKWSASHVAKQNLVLNSYLLPGIGKRDVATLTSGDVVKVLRKMPPSLAVKAAGVAKNVIRSAIVEGLREEGKLLDLDPRNNLPKRNKGHLPAATTPAEVALVMDTIRGLQGDVVRAALLMCAYTAQRPGNVAAMLWEHIDVQTSEWIIPAAAMKMRTSHVVPLSRQALEVIESMRGRDVTWVFPPVSEQKTPHVHRDALSKALRDAGLRGKQTPHGLRATLRTVARERLDVPGDELEAQLAHAKRGETQGAYDRTGLVKQRHAAMQRWADYLDAQKIQQTGTPTE